MKELNVKLCKICFNQESIWYLCYMNTIVSDKYTFVSTQWNFFFLNKSRKIVTFTQMVHKFLSEKVIFLFIT